MCNTSLQAMSIHETGDLFGHSKGTTGLFVACNIFLNTQHWNLYLKSENIKNLTGNQMK